MAPLLLSEEDVENLLSVQDTIPVIEHAFLQQKKGSAVNRPRTRIAAGADREIHFMEASENESEIHGFKTYTKVAGQVRYFVYLFSSTTGELLSILDAKKLGQLRTGAATAVATKYMARKDVTVAGILGSGYQARTQLEAVCEVRSIVRALVYSPTEANRECFASEMSSRLDIPVVAVSNPKDVVEKADVLSVITKSTTPVFDGNWLMPGTHVVAAGGASPFVSELDETTLRRAALIAVDDISQARIESGELIVPTSSGAILWEQVRNLWQVVGGEVPGRNNAHDITLFKSLGMALWDIVAAKAVYKKAIEKDKGIIVDW